MPSPKKPAKKSSKAPAAEGPQVVVLGDHLAAHLASLRLANAGVSVLCVDLGTNPCAQQVLPLNPQLFALMPELQDVAADFGNAPIAGVRFLDGEGNVAATTGELGKNLGKRPKDEPFSLIVQVADLAAAVKRLAADAGVQQQSASVTAEEVGSGGLALKVGRSRVAPALAIASDPLPTELAAALGVGHAGVDDGRPSARVAVCPSGVQATRGLPDNVVPMALDIGGVAGTVGWLWRQGDAIELAAQVPAGVEATAVLRDWLGRLQAAEIVTGDSTVDGRCVRTAATRPAGALQHDVIGRRTLLCGPCGGFVASLGEELYPAAWSALYAADTARKALKAPHVQDALGDYRRQWGGTLGEYLLGPQQNLEFLLPLIFRNPPMTDRVAEAVLRGQSLVR